MKNILFALLTIIAALILSGAVRAEITTVILSDDPDPNFTVSAQDDPNDTVPLKFSIGPALPDDAKVEECILRVVPLPAPEGSLRPGDQDVSVHFGDKLVGGWSAYGKTPKPYIAELATPEDMWRPMSESVVTLKTESERATWTYYGGGAISAANRPRLIVTYDSPSRPTPARSGQASFSSTSWTLPDGNKLTPLANPVSYKGASYLIAEGRLYQWAGPGEPKYWKLPFGITADSFAFVTAWGRLQIITEDAIGSFDLENLGEPNGVLTEPAHVVINDPNTIQIQVQNKETPAMGPDGSLYFRNVKADGCIVAYNPSLQEIWRTELKFTTVSPISLSTNGHHAYVLADIPVQEGNAKDMFALLCIDTATGETEPNKVEYEDVPGKHVSPILTELLQPAVASKGNVDYVFVAGNTNDKGIFQLVAFEPSAETYERREGKPPKVLWNRLGKVAKHELSGADRFSLFVFGDGSLNLYPFDSSLDSAMEKAVSSVGCAGALLSDGAVPLYMFDTNDLVKRMTALERERDKAKDDAKKTLGEKGQLKKELDEAKAEARELLDEKGQLENAKADAEKRLAEEEQELAKLNKQISRARTRGALWGLGIAGVTIAVCLLLSFWILRRQEEKTGRA